jgi:hypothetical protein
MGGSALSRGDTRDRATLSAARRSSFSPSDVEAINAANLLQHQVVSRRSGIISLHSSSHPPASARRQCHSPPRFPMSASATICNINARH